MSDQSEFCNEVWRPWRSAWGKSHTIREDGDSYCRISKFVFSTTGRWSLTGGSVEGGLKQSGKLVKQRSNKLIGCPLALTCVGAEQSWVRLKSSESSFRRWPLMLVVSLQYQCLFLALKSPTSRIFFVAIRWRAASNWIKGSICTIFRRPVAAAEHERSYRTEWDVDFGDKQFYFWRFQIRSSGAWDVGVCINTNPSTVRFPVPSDWWCEAR